MKRLFSLLLLSCLLLCCRCNSEVTRSNIPSESIIVMAHEDRGIYYDISQDNHCTQLKIWENIDDKKTSVFAFQSENTKADVEKILPILNSRRKEWMQLCNEHHTEALVDNLYSETAIYFNHKPHVVGRSAIVEEYSYMQRPDYKLSLTPEQIKVANSETVFEIGQCSGSYGGKYLLIWKKESDGVWRIIIDSNV